MAPLEKMLTLLLLLMLGHGPSTTFGPLLFGIVSSLAAVGQESQSRHTTVPFSALSKAMLGVDPVLSNPLGERDPGLKDQIFIPSSSFSDCKGVIELNSFIGKAVEDVRCNHMSLSSMRTASNFEEYKKLMSESVSFKVEAGLSSGFLGFGGGVQGRYGSILQTNEQKYVAFFKRTGGEIVRGSAQCQTHVVSVNLDIKPVFSENFLSALTKLNQASMDPLSEDSRKTFFNFVDHFGTHFQYTTFLGSKLVVEKLFSKQSANSAENNGRHRCVATALTQSLRLNLPFSQAEENFRRDSNQCTESEEAEYVLNSLGIASERIMTIGTAPYLDSDEWARHALLSPVPIHYSIEKISRMFMQDWFASLSEEFNGTAMQDFFEKMSTEYCKTMLGEFCDTDWKGCGFNSNCKLEEKCVDDNTTALGFLCKKGCGFTSDCPDPQVCVDDNSVRGFNCIDPCSIPDTCSTDETCYHEPHSVKGYICVSMKPGEAVVAGGWGLIDGAQRPLKAVEHINYKSFPQLPRGVYGSAMAAAGDFIYICGGIHQDIDGSYYPTDNCYYIHKSNPGGEWVEMQSVPIKMGYATVVSINGSLLWFIQNNDLVKFDSKTGMFSKTTLPFTAHSYHCSVSNRSHAFVIGAGLRRNEIWTNEKPGNETKWRKVGKLSRSVSKHACLLYDSNIMITGGSQHRERVEMFNTESREVWTGVNLLTGRNVHRMMLHNGMPTVLGGFGTTFLDSIEHFSIAENRWINGLKTLKEVKSYFSFVEL